MHRNILSAESIDHDQVNLLAGANIVITRPSATAATLKRRAIALGGNVISLPGTVLKCAQVTACVIDALINARHADAVIFVSPAAVRFAFALRPGLRFARHSTILAVGNTTAKGLTRRGFANVRQPTQRQDSEGLLALPELVHVRGKTVALIGAAGGRGLLEQTLQERNAKVESIHVYQRNVPRFSRSQLIKLEQTSQPLITLASSADVLRNLKATLPLHLYARLASGELVVSSERLATIARSQLFARVHIAASAAPADLLHAARNALSRHRL